MSGPLDSTWESTVQYFHGVFRRSKQKVPTCRCPSASNRASLFPITQASLPLCKGQPSLCWGLFLHPPSLLSVHPCSLYYSLMMFSLQDLR